jgi:integrase
VFLPLPHWPRVRYRPKRAITAAVHERIIQHEPNPERCSYYQLPWELGGSQGDIARLKAKNIDWAHRSYVRAKTGQPVRVRFDEAVEKILRTLPGQGPRFPYLCMVRAGDRATEFRQRCPGLGMAGITLHSYRYSWAERARACGYPEWLAQQALGHGSLAVHQAYAHGVQAEHLRLGESQRRQAALTLIPVDPQCSKP